MRQIKIGEPVDITYPIGNHMSTALKAFDKMFNRWYQQFREDIQQAPMISLICTGSSGAIMATLFYTELQHILPNQKVVINHVKKPNEDSHSSSKIGSAGHYHSRQALTVFVDDFAQTGETILRTLGDIRNEYSKAFQFDHVVISGYNNTVLDKLRKFKATKFIVGYNADEQY